MKLLLAATLVFPAALGAAANPAATTCPLPHRIRVRTVGSTPTLAYAAGRLIDELHRLHGTEATVEAVPPDFDGVPDDAAVFLGRVGGGWPPPEWCRRQGIPLPDAEGLGDGYRIVVRADPLRVFVFAGTDVGVWYGACAWLDSLRSGADGQASAPVSDRSESPALALRFTRGLAPGGRFSCIDDARPSLDWWARWRMNVTCTGPMPEPLLREFLAEAHRRGIRVLHSLGVRSLCAADDRAVAACAAEFEQFLRAGGDGVSALWDDLPHDRCRGHCDRCRERFGPDSLPREIARVLEALCDVAEKRPVRPLILWCPPHYSENRYPEMADEVFFREIGKSPAIQRQTHMYYCEFAPRPIAVLDRAGLRHRVWWYNGMRTVYHLCRHWPTDPASTLAIPGLKSFAAPDFARFDMGWKTGVLVGEDGRIVAPAEAVWQALRTVPDRYEGFYPCMDQHPYHGAVAALYALAPPRFSQAEADRIVFRAIFGPGSAGAAREWSDLYNDLQVRLARASEHAATDAEVDATGRRVAHWRGRRLELEALAARGRSLLPREILGTVLARMRDAERQVQEIAERRRPGATATRPVAENGRETERKAQ